MDCGLVFLDGGLYIAVSTRAGAVLMHPGKCILPDQAKFPEATREESRSCSISILNDLPEASVSSLVRYRGHLTLQIQQGGRFFMCPMPRGTYPLLIQTLLKQHVELKGLYLKHIERSDLSAANDNYGLLSSAKTNGLFGLGWRIDVGTLLKLKLDLCFNSEYLEPMVESPRLLNKSELDVCVMEGSLLGEGTYGQVYEISFPSSLSEVKACKRLVKGSKEDMGGFFKNIMAEITGLQLCSSVDIHIVNPHTIHLVMPMHGRSNLEKVMSQRRMDRGYSPAPLFTVEEHLGIFRGISLVLQKLHSRGMAHLDIKMCNMIGPVHHYVTNLIDYGLCSLQEGPQKEVLKITVDTRDPEIFLGRECFTWSDIWSMGVIFADLVLEKRFSVIPFYQQGTWPNGKAFDWSKQENELSLRFINERINDSESLDEFLLGLYGKVPSMSLGVACILSSCLWKNPGKRSTFGFLDSVASVSMSKWPLPVFRQKPNMYPPTVSSKHLKLEKHRGHFCLDGSGPFKLVNDIPALPMVRHKVTDKRRFQLQFIAAVLIDLKKFSLKTFLLAVDVLDRVSTPGILSNVRALHPANELYALETVCIYFALLQSCPTDMYFEIVVQKALENLPIQHPRDTPVLWNLFLDLLSTLKFHQSWEDSLWNLVVSLQKFSIPGFGKALMESLLSWPDGVQTTKEFVGSIGPRTSLPSYFSSNIPIPRVELSWLTPEFQHLITSSPFLDVHVQSKLSNFMAFPSSPQLSPLLSAYLQEHASTHPFFIPLIPGLKRSELHAGIQEHCARQSVPDAVLKGESCVICHDLANDTCCACQQWSVCKLCAKSFGGRCSQCIYPCEMEEWKRLHKS